MLVQGVGRRFRRDFERLHGHAGLDLLQTGHDHAIARGQSVLDQPLIADGARHLDLAHLDLGVVVDHQRRGTAFWVARDGALRRQQTLWHRAFTDDGTHIHAGHQHVVRVGHDGA